MVIILALIILNDNIRGGETAKQDFVIWYEVNMVIPHYLKCTWVKLPSWLLSRSSNVSLKNINCTVIIIMM